MENEQFSILNKFFYLVSNDMNVKYVSCKCCSACEESYCPSIIKEQN